jgi:MFS transporter, NNP family, nitrate/nitrite transporter
MVAFGWEAVAQVWALVLAVMGVIFFLFAKDDPEARRARKASGASPRASPNSLRR